MSSLAKEIFQQSSKDEEEKKPATSLTRLSNMSRIIPLESLVGHEKNRELDQEKIKAYAESILINGLLQDPVVKPKGDGTYTILSGHHRIEACRRLQKMDSQYAQVRCKLLDVDDLDAELALLDSNIETNPLSPYDMMLALGRKEEILKEKRVKGTLRAIISEDLGMKPTQVGKYLKVYKKGCEELWKQLKDGSITLEKAAAISNLSQDEQKNAILPSTTEEVNPKVKELKEYERVLKKTIAAIECFINSFYKHNSLSSEEIPEILKLACTYQREVEAHLELTSNRIKQFKSLKQEKEG